MKLCKACNQPVDVPSWNFCNREVCLSARKALAKARYKKVNLNPYAHYDERMNWICDCWNVVPAKFTCCADCGAKQRDRYTKKERVFIPSKHIVSIEEFVNDYFNKQDEICREYKI